ncbi:MAG: hypothetical protein QNJ38_15630 [Prochloraceae cyanobacterium]|nr:hypothetical protein [Prochloraceae cyanobacterium]
MRKAIASNYLSKLKIVKDIKQTNTILDRNKQEQSVFKSDRLIVTDLDLIAGKNPAPTKN